MLYERWRQVAHQFSGEIAIRELATGRRWTFGQLAQAAENWPAGESGRVSFPQGNGSPFILEMLAAWRDHRLVCPLEQGQGFPSLSASLPPQNIVHLKITSASTGAARMVLFKAEQLMADAHNIVRTMGLRPEWPNLGVISLAHSYGFSNLVLPLALHGIPLIMVGATLPEAVRQACASQRELTLAGVPALWRTWHEADALCSAIRLGISAGAPLPIQLEQDVFSATGLKIHNFYGSSECGGIAYDAADRPRSDASLAGTPMKDVEVCVAGDGCLSVRGAAVGEGYWPVASDRLASGVFHTSDLAEVFEGRVYLRGRATDLINIAGRKISPEAIEQTLSTHPLVRECLVFGVPSREAERGDVIVAVAKVNGKPCGDLLKRYLAERLPAWQVPREWWFVDSLAFNRRGKLSRPEIRSRYLDFKGSSTL